MPVFVGVILILLGIASLVMSGLAFYKAAKMRREPILALTEGLLGIAAITFGGFLISMPIVYM